MPAVDWIDGGAVDLERVGVRARDLGAVLVVDATQLLGAIPLDLAAVRPRPPLAASLDNSSFFVVMSSY